MVQKRYRSSKSLLKTLSICFVLAIAAISVVYFANTFTKTSPTNIDAAGLLPRLRVDGNKIVTTNNNQSIVLRGMNVCGLEFSKGQFTDKYRLSNGESGLVKDLRSQWNVNIVRMTLAQDWLLYDSDYFNKVGQIIDDADRKGVYIILDNQWEKGGSSSIALKPSLGDGNTTEAFWKKVAQNWGNRTNLIYDIINEPHASTSLSGDAEMRYKAEVATLMQKIIDSVNSVQDDAVFMVSEPNWSHDLYYYQNTANVLNPGRSNGIIYSVHQYSDLDPISELPSNFGNASKSIAVFLGEFDTGIGKNNPQYTQQLINYAENNGVDGWAGWSMGCGHSGSGDYRISLSSYPGHEPIKYIVDLMKAKNIHPSLSSGTVSTPIPTSGSSSPTPITTSGGRFVGITDGQSVSGKINVYYEPGTSASSVRFYVDNNFVNNETVARYYVGGDNSNTPYGYDTTNLANGTHTLRADVYNSSGVKVETSQISFTKGTTSTNTNLVSSDSRVKFVETKSREGSKVYIRVDVSGTTVNKIVFLANGNTVNTEYTSPYFIGGDASGSPYGYVLPQRSNSFVARVYTSSTSYFEAKTSYSY